MEIARSQVFLPWKPACFLKIDMAVLSCWPSCVQGSGARIVRVYRCYCVRVQVCIWPRRYSLSQRPYNTTWSMLTVTGGFVWNALFLWVRQPAVSAITKCLVSRAGKGNVPFKLCVSLSALSCWMEGWRHAEAAAKKKERKTWKYWHSRCVSEKVEEKV